MQITDHTLTVDSTNIDLPKLAVASTVHVWTVPTAYRANGYFVSAQVPGQPQEIPACDGREAVYLGKLTLGAALDMELQAAKDAAVGRLDASAEALCAAALTPGSTQMERYRRKRTLAAAFLAETIPTDETELAVFETTYAVIYNEVGISGPTATDVAQTISDRAQAWDSLCDAVEQVRMQAKAAVDAAPDLAGVAAAEAAVVWPEGG